MEVRNVFAREDAQKRRQRWLKDMEGWREDKRRNRGRHGDIERNQPEEPDPFALIPSPDVPPERQARARELRGQALILLEKAWENRDMLKDTSFELPYLLADLHRRAGNFEEAVGYLRLARKTNKAEQDVGENTRNWLELLFGLQEKLIKAKDSGRRDTASIMPER